MEVLLTYLLLFQSSRLNSTQFLNKRGFHINECPFFILNPNTLNTYPHTISINGLLLLFILLSSNLTAQNTIGTVTYTPDSYAGYTLFTPTTTTLPTYTYLIDNCGQVINQWESPFKGQGADEIMEDGTLFRGSFDNNSTLTYPGNNGRLEHYDWDGTLLWGYTYSETDFSFHHDYAVLPNGNVLMLVAERKTLAEAIQAGRDPNTITENELYTEKIIEVQPVGLDDGIIVWEWDLWNHLVQNFDATKDNFGNVSNTPRKLDINFLGFSAGIADWTHMNSLDYNEDLDQIMISSRFMSEIYIIDHSTTTAEAATNSGGNSNLGGSFLYRWGNPQSYQRGTSADQILFGQHTAHWIEDQLPNAGDILVFNNGFQRGFSSVDLIEQPTPDSNGVYPIMNATAFEPTSSNVLYPQFSSTPPLSAPFLSSAFILPNGNVLIDNGPAGITFEVNDNDETVWKYLNPVLNTGGILSQGDPHNPVDSRIFRVRRYALDYAGFDGRDLTPGLPIELNSTTTNCEPLHVPENFTTLATIAPNPASDFISIQTDHKVEQIEIYTMLGQKSLNSTQTRIDVSELKSGLYLMYIKLDTGYTTQKFIKR